MGQSLRRPAIARQKYCLVASDLMCYTWHFLLWRVCGTVGEIFIRPGALHRDALLGLRSLIMIPA